jgi:Glycosyltransferases, probably involved in cell wall biogenesis
MEAVFWILMFTIGYAYAGYPLVTFAVSAFINNKVRKKDIEPAVTFLITVFNEEKSIGEKLESTLALDYPPEKLEILVASDASTDGTDEIVERYAPRVRLARMPVRAGKTEAQNRAVAMAKGEIIVFSDGTTRYERSAVRAIVSNYADPSVGAVGGRFRYVDKDGTGIGTGTKAFWDYESRIKSLQTRIGTITGCSGCIYSVRAAAYEPLPADIVSDLVEPLAVLKKGYRVVFEEGALAYEDTCKRRDDEFRMRVRVISRGMRGLVYMRALLNPFRHPLIAFQLISHKILRWFVPVLAIALYVVNGAIIDKSPFYFAFFALQAGFYLLGAVGIFVESLPRRIKILSIPLYFCVINTACLVAMWRTLMRKKDITWETVR